MILMNKSDLIAALAVKENLTENQATDTIDLIFNVELNADERSITGRCKC
jgi:nucleoid DNA-binding protein